MKGIVFSEFIDMVESRFGLETADAIITESNLASGGAYTAVGTYDHRELLQLLQRLSTRVGVPIPELVRGFGQHLFGRFVELYPFHFTGLATVFDFLAALDSKVHAEVRKLYPDAELPSFEHERPDSRRLIMTYRSTRPFADLAEGLIRGCIAHFREPIELRREDLPAPAGSHTRFTLTLAGDD
jgi:hypothetical protein